jgi:hypothetical protein
MLNKPSPADFAVLAKFSHAKIVSLTFAALMLAVIPNLPGFEEGLRRTAYLYSPLGSIIRLVACAILGVMGLVLAAMLFEATFVSPIAVWIEGSELRWRALGVKRMPLSAIRSVTLQPRHIRVERTDGGKNVEISTVSLRSSDAPEPLLARLRDAANLSA